ncbi:hypothetical protein [Streptomyces sp. NPDC006446]
MSRPRRLLHRPHHPEPRGRAGALDARVATSGALLFRCAEEAYEQAAL